MANSAAQSAASLDGGSDPVGAEQQRTIALCGDEITALLRAEQDTRSEPWSEPLAKALLDFTMARVGHWLLSRGVFIPLLDGTSDFSSNLEDFEERISLAMMTRDMASVRRALAQYELVAANRVVLDHQFRLRQESHDGDKRED